MGYDEKKFLKELSGVRGATRVTTDNPEETYDALKKYGSNPARRRARFAAPALRR